MNPGTILGGLAQVGAQGGIGATSGMLEGEQFKRRLTYEDLQNQLMLLSLLSGKQQLENPPAEIHGGIMYQRTPSGQLLPMGPTPQPPLTPVQQAQIKEREAATASHEAAAARAMRETPEKQTSETNFWATLGQKVAAGQASPVEQHMWELHQRAEKGTTGHVVPKGGAFVDPSGRILYERPAGTPSSLVPRTTTSEQWDIVPRKPIKGEQEITDLNRGVQGVVAQLSRKPGFNVPGFYATAPNGQKILKTDLIKEAFRRLDPPVEVEVMWDGSQFKIVRAWEPEQRKLRGMTRTTGPAGGRSEEEQ